MHSRCNIVRPPWVGSSPISMYVRQLCTLPLHRPEIIVHYLISLDTNNCTQEIQEELRRSRSFSPSIKTDECGDRSPSSSSTSAIDTSYLTVSNGGASGPRRSFTDISDSRECPPPTSTSSLLLMEVVSLPAGSSASSSVLQVPTIPLQRSRSCDHPRPLQKPHSLVAKLDHREVNLPLGN